MYNCSDYSGPSLVQTALYQEVLKSVKSNELFGLVKTSRFLWNSINIAIIGITSTVKINLVSLQAIVEQARSAVIV